MNRRQFVDAAIVAGISVGRVRLLSAAETDGAKRRTTGIPVVDYRLTRDAETALFDGQRCYAHPRAGIVPGAGNDGRPRVVMTMNTIQLVGSDVFKAMREMTSNDLGKTWSEAKEAVELMPRMEMIEGENRPVALSDFWPAWHKKSKALLGTGHTVAYTPGWKVVPDRPQSTTYAVYNAANARWLPWQKLPMPESPKFDFAGAGCTQRFDLPNGTILLPMYFRKRMAKGQISTVMHCSFDGQSLRYLDRGDEISIVDDTRGFSEPSLTCFDGTYYLTLRHPLRAYVASSRDGLHFEPVRPWTFDDGSDLGSYETQAHWVTHSDGLFLVYTRRGANNNQVFRNRAPLFMAQVDPQRLVVLRETERKLMPNRGAGIGNFGVTQVSKNETWVTDSELMQPKGCEKHGSDGSVWVSRIHWAKPNGYF